MAKEIFASRVRSFQGALIAFLFVSQVVQSEATIYTVNYTSSGNAYSAAYDSSQDGFTSWSQNGQNQLVLQLLYYRIGSSGSPTLLTPASVTTGNAGSGKKITVNYTISDGTIQDVMTLIGNTLSESIEFNNSSGGSVDMSIFQYSDFVLGGSGYAGSQTVIMTPYTVNEGYAVANQIGGGLTFSWQGFVNGGTTLVQADSSGAPFGAFIGSGTDLDNATLTAYNTSAVFGFEFSGTVANGNNLLISENTAFPVPEPSSAALIASGMLAFSLIFLQRRSKKA